MNAFRTPITTHLRTSEFVSVYEPAEDTFLLLDALEKDWDFIDKLSPSICLEMGCGSGAVSSFVAQNLTAPCFFLSVDINEAAASATAATFRCNVDRRDVTWDTLNSDLAAPLIPFFGRKVDLIIFNPPYVVTTDAEIFQGDEASRAWAGGYNGRQIMDRFFPQAAALLSLAGVFYCVIIEENDPDDIARLLSRSGLRTDIIEERRCRNEHLAILRITRKGAPGPQVT